jgi:hypothetical protein
MREALNFSIKKDWEFWSCDPQLMITGQGRCYWVIKGREKAWHPRLAKNDTLCTCNQDLWKRRREDEEEKERERERRKS